METLVVRYCQFEVYKHHRLWCLFIFYKYAMTEKLLNNREPEKGNEKLQPEFLTSIIKISEQLLAMPKAWGSSKSLENLPKISAHKSKSTGEITISYDAVSENDLGNGIKRIDIGISTKPGESWFLWLTVNKYDNIWNQVSNLSLNYELKSKQRLVMWWKGGVEQEMLWAVSRLSNEEIKEQFLVPVTKRLNEAQVLLEKNKQKVLTELGELAKLDQKIPDDLEQKMNNLT